MNLSDILPPRLRYGIYVTLVLAGVTLGVVQTWSEAAGTATPGWHAPALAVLGYLSTAVGLVAAANVRQAPLDADVLEREADLEDADDDWDDEVGSDDLRGERV